MINRYDNDMLITIANLYKSINGENLDLENITKAADALLKYNTKSEYNYLNYLLYPEKCKNVRIPSPIPVPSCSFQLHNCITLSTNASGNLAFSFNPFFLANQNNLNNWGEKIPSWFSTLWVNNDDTLTGNERNDNFWPINIGQTIPNVYDQYRLVSASIVVKYIGRLDIVSGVIGGAIVYNDDPTIGVHFSGGGTVAESNTTNVYMAKYGNFDLAMDSFYHQEYMVLDGLRQLYFPLDNSFEEYTKLIGTSQTNFYKLETGRFLAQIPDHDIFKSGFNQFVYVLGAPPSSSCFKVDIYCNFECLPSSEFLNYMPTSTCLYSISNQEKKETIDIIQKTPIMKSNEIIDFKTPSSLGWKEYMKYMAKRFNAMPSIPKLIGMGLEYFVPKMKPILGVLGTVASNEIKKQQEPAKEQEPNKPINMNTE
jgi:hypothetical protein